MLRLEAEKAARQMIMSGYRHHRYEDELKTSGTFFQLEREEFLKLIHTSWMDTTALAYVDVLGPTRLRALKNSLICFIAPICRLAIGMRADPELCYALSDFYINYLEGIDSEQAMLELFRHVALHYYDLVQNEERQHYSKPIARAVRYIGRNLYSSYHVSEVADYVGLERHYFSSLFSKQVGMPPGKYILMRKLEEGRRILTHTGITVAEAAESLGFYDAAHFSRQFKEAYGLSPSCVSKRDEAWA